MRVSDFKHLSFPSNLWSTVFQREVNPREIPSDWQITLVSLLASLGSERRGKALLLYYEEQKTMREIGRLLGISMERARQHITASIRRLQKPSSRKIMEYGLERATYLRENKLDYWSDAVSTPTGIDMENILDLPISALEISARPYGCLRRHGIQTIAQLMACSKEELLQLRNFGSGSMDEISRSLARFGLSL